MNKLIARVIGGGYNPLTKKLTRGGYKYLIASSSEVKL